MVVGTVSYWLADRFIGGNDEAHCVEEWRLANEDAHLTRKTAGVGAREYLTESSEGVGNPDIAGDDGIGLGSDVIRFLSPAKLCPCVDFPLGYPIAARCQANIPKGWFY